MYSPISDIKGNVLLRQGDFIVLMLRKEVHPRKIGRLIEAEETLEVYRDSALHLFRKINAYGFNDTVLRTATKFKQIRVVVDGGQQVYLIPRDVIMTEGTYLQFGEQGFEIQIFVRLTILNRFKIS